MDNAAIGLRTQDYHEALRTTSAFGPREAHFTKTLLMGKAATLAVHLRGLLYVEDYDNLVYAAAELGITGIELPLVLQTLQELDFVRVINDAAKIKRVDVRVPQLRDGYEDIGALWVAQSPTEIETAGVTLLDDLIRSPVAESRLAQLGLDSAGVRVLRDVMESGKLLDVQAVAEEPIAYTPLAVDANPSAYLEWSRRYDTDASQLLSRVAERPGQIADQSAFEDSDVLRAAVSMGVLMPVTVQGGTGCHGFVFSPRGGLEPHDRIILDKARAIIACVRYGQVFAANRPILYPRAILQTLRDEGRFNRSHPDLKSQYSLLTQKMIGRPVQSGSGWNFEIIDTDENKAALQLAIDMLEGSPAPSPFVNLDAKRALVSPQGYVGPITARPRMSHEITASSETREVIMGEMMGLLRGVGRG